MPNISLRGEEILLQSGKSYYIFDALYIDHVKNEINIINPINLENDIRTKILPYSETPFAIISLNHKSGFGLQELDIRNIKRTDEIGISSFSSDTGLIILLEKSIFFNFLKSFNYNELVEGISDPINISYWTELEEKFPDHYCGLILSPGINTGFEFEGSGQYRIEI